jgi:hypothetical protein
MLLQSFSAAEGEIQGSLNIFSGSEIERLVHQWARRPKAEFNYLRLIIWLRSHIRVPHLAFEFGTIGQLLCYMDYIPRTDLSYDLEYLDKYYEPVNETYLKFLADTRFQQFNSKNTYIRQVFSPTCLCFTSPITEEIITIISNTAYEMMERWLKWVDEAEPVPESARNALSQYDLILRRTIAERDPGNETAEQRLGEELADKIVRALWGG